MAVSIGPAMSALADGLAVEIGELLAGRDATIAVAESLTGGLVVQTLARTSGSGEWLAGGVVSYATAVKRRVLGVTAASVISAECAEQMAAGVRNLLGADVSVAVTGVGGPDDQEGEPPGTVWLAVNDGTAAPATLLRAEGGPTEICDASVAEALRCVLHLLRSDRDGADPAAERVAS